MATLPGYKTRTAGPKKPASSANYDWISSYQPTTASPNVKGNLTSIKKNAQYDPKKVDVGKVLSEALDFVSRPQRAVTGALAEWTGGGNVLDGLKAAGKGITGKEKVDFDQVLNNLNWKNKEGKFDLHDVASFAGNVLLDPLTYLTLGAGSAAKATAKGVAQGTKAATKQGLVKGSQAYEQVVDNSIKAAKAANNQRLVGIDIPFGPSATIFKKKGPLKIEVQKVGDKPASDLHKLLDDIGLAKPEHYQAAEKLLNRPIQSFKDLNTQEFKFIEDALSGANKAGWNPANVVNRTPVEDLAHLVQNVQGKAYQFHDGLEGVSKLGKLVGTSKPVEMAGKLLGSRRFVPMSTKLSDHRVQGGINALLNEQNKGFAYSKNMLEKLKNLKNDPDIKALSPDELKQVAFHMENAFPQGMQAQPHIQKAADKFRQYMDEVTQMEQQAGANYTPRQDYFPHNMNIPHEGTSDWDELVTELMNAGRSDIITKLQNAQKGFTKQRKGFQTMAELHDYIQANPGSKLANASFDPYDALGKRTISGMSEVARLESINALKDMGLVHQITKNGPKMIKGWKEVEGIPELAGTMVPKEIHKELTGLHKLLSNDVELNSVVKKADHVYNMWRRNVTVTKVGFHVRQTIGNIFQNTIAGVTPNSYTKAATYLANPDKYPKLTQELLENGVLHTGSSSADLMTNLGLDAQSQMKKSSILGSINPLGDQFILGKYGRLAGEYEDNWARVAHYVHMKGKGMKPQEASDSVRKYLFNYSEINKVGQGIRVFLPFYQWMRNNVPFQIVNALKNPRMYSITEKLLEEGQNPPDAEQAMTDMGINTPQDRSLVNQLIAERGGILPDFIQQQYVNVGKDAEGNNKYFNLGLPSSDLKNLTDVPEYLMNSMNPLLKSALELTTNRKFLSGGPIDKSQDIGENVWATLPGVKHLGESVLGGPAQLLSGDWEKGLGVNRTTVDPKKEINSILYQKKKELELAKKNQKELLQAK